MTRTTHDRNRVGWLFLAAWSLTGLSPAAEPALVEVSFCQAAGITPERLETLVQTQLGGCPHGLVLTLTLHDEADDCLVRGEVTFRWEGGRQKVPVPESGVIALPLEPARLRQLTILSPPGYTRLRQFTFPEGPAYVSPPAFVGFGDEVRYDAAIKEQLRRQLLDFRGKKDVANPAVLREQLQRRHAALALAAPAANDLSAEEIYRQCRSAVVGIASLLRCGHLGVASGVIIAPAGVVVTNYHVLDKSERDVELFGAMTEDGRVFPVTEVLAADPVNDIAVLRIAAADLPAVPLSPGVPVGTAVTVIGHPDEHFYSLHHGRVSRYSTWINRGQYMVVMAITAEFTRGSSGGPVFAADGSLAGLTTSRKKVADGLVIHQCVPARAIRALLEDANGGPPGAAGNGQSGRPNPLPLPRAASTSICPLVAAGRRCRDGEL